MNCEHQPKGSMHKQILHIHTPLSSTRKTPLYLATPECQLLSNAGFHWQVLWISIAVVSVAKVMRQSFEAKLWNLCIYFWSETIYNIKNVFSYPWSSTLSSQLTYRESFALLVDVWCLTPGPQRAIVKALLDQRLDLIPVVSKESDLPHSDLLYYPFKIPVGQRVNWKMRQREESGREISECCRSCFVM